MVFPSSTAFFAALFALIYVGLAGWVVAGRVQADVLHGDGGDDALERRIRCHGNFAEYVPFALLLMAFFEADYGSTLLVRVLLTILLVARLAHPVGMFAPKNSPQQFGFRGGGIVATFGVIVVTAIAILVKLA